MKERNYLFDNLKFLLIVLVVFGHSLEEISLAQDYAIIRAWIYSFHMPAFVFILGYFSKSVRRGEGARKTIINCAIPYFIFNTIFALCTEKTLVINILTPKYIFWYLFSLLIWRLLIFPYFLLGVFADEAMIEKVRKMPKRYSIIMSVILSISVIILHIKNMIPVKAYENIQCYQESGMNNLQGMAIRLFSYGVGIAAIFCIVNLVSNEKKWYTVYGSRTACIYIASAFSVKILYKFIDYIWNTDFLLSHIEVGILWSLCVTIITIFTFGSKKISDTYLNVNKKLGDVLVKSGE